MPFKTESGAITAVIRGARPAYQVRLRSGLLVVVGNDQIVPPRMTLLLRGQQLLVTYSDSGKVSAAAVKDTRTGRVVRVSGPANRIVYQVELDPGEYVQAPRSAVSPHPQRPLAVGAELELLFEQGELRQARLTLERLEVTVERVEREQNTLLVRSRQGESTSVRLPAAALRERSVGEMLIMELHYGEQGERRVVLQAAQPGAAAAWPAREAPPIPGRPPGEKPRDAAPRSRPGGPRSSAQPVPQPVAVEAEIAGIDPLYLVERRRENHRAEIMSFLEEHARDGLVEWYRMRPAVQPRFAEPQRPLAALVQQALHAADPNFEHFYQHQARALDAIRAGKHVVIVTQTASGKTLSYNPAIFETMAGDAGPAYALYLFPLNALMMDQKEKIDALCKSLNQRGAAITSGHLFGGMGVANRQEIARRPPNLLATNPEMLGVILNEAGSWAGFFRALRYVVIDEVHSYRGIFGVHMAGLLRRLLLTARKYGAEPRMILSSATVSNPLDLAARLTALPKESFELIGEDADGSRQGCKHWTVLSPDWGSARARAGSYLDVAAHVFIELVSGRRGHGKTAAPLNTILFARSIRDVNRLYRLVSENLRGQDPALLARIKSYVSADMTVQEKREIYEGLRSGRMVGVISTNALEAGIDIGALDACIVAGFPFSVMRMRQMAGRVGRKNEGLVAFVPYALSGLDGYYRDHPDLLLSQPPEEFVVDPENPYVARKHINAAAAALGGLRQEDLHSVWGPRSQAILDQAVRDRVMSVNGGRYFGTRRDYSNLEDVYAVHSIRSNNQAPYAICLDDGIECQLSPACFSQQRRGCSRQVTVLDRDYAYRDCHPGAVYESVSGRLYRVTQFDDQKRSVRVRELPEDALERTSVEEDVQIELAGAPRQVKTLCPGVSLAWGNVVVTRSFTGYRAHTLVPARSCRRCRKEYNEDTLRCPSCGRPTETSYFNTPAERQDFPGEHVLGFRVVLKTVACWLSVEPELENALQEASPCKLPGASNHVQGWLQGAFSAGRLRLKADEQRLAADFHARAGGELRALKPTAAETVLYPGIYGQCLLHALREKTGESRALEVFAGLTGYPVTDDLRHVCRKCQTSTLMEALHTLEHCVLLRYPSVALGDRSDLGALSTLGHAGAGSPAVFWYDDYEGGLGAAEKIFDKFTELLQSAGQAVQDCSCTTLEGCPRCTHVGGSPGGNESLSKPAVLALVNRISGSAFSLGARPFVYRRKHAADFDKASQRNEFARAAHGVGEEAPSRAGAGPVDPYLLLRIQRDVHEQVARKAFEVRSQEISQETPPVSATELNSAYQSVLRGRLLEDWQLESALPPYRVLEVQPDASTRMIQGVYRVIAMQVHPDANPNRRAWANEMMKQINAAYEAVLADKKVRNGG